MNETLRRATAGLIVGLVVAVMVLLLVTLSARINADGVTVRLLGGPLIVLGGGLLGVSTALLFRPRADAYADSLMRGVVLGIAAWIVLAVNLFPLLQGDRPMWDVRLAADIFPKLIAFVLQGSLIGPIYTFLLRRAGRRRTDGPAATPDARLNVVIVGGGYAGVAAAQSLDGLFAGDPAVAVCLVNKTNYLVHTPMLSEVSSSAVNAQNISPPLRSFFKDVRVIQGEVDAVDWELGRLTIRAGRDPMPRELAFDHLIVTVGGVPNYFGNADVEANTLTFKSLADSIRLRNQVIDMFEGADGETDSQRRRQMLTFVVVGGGFAGVELIGGLNDFGRGMLPYYPNLTQQDLRFVLIHTRDVILPELSRELGQFAQQKMAARGVEFILNARVTGARPGVCLLADSEILSDTVVWTAGNRPHPLVAKLDVTLDKRGKIPVTGAMQSDERPNLWAAGDCALIPDPGGGYYPPTAQHASREGKLLGKNVAAVIRGQQPKPFVFQTLGSLAALGHQVAVAEVFGYRFSGFLAWLMWRAIYLSKLPSFEKRVRVLLDWILDIYFPPDIVQTLHFGERPGEERSA